MLFPFSKLPGYPEEANTTETAKPGRNANATESSRCSTQDCKVRERQRMVNPVLGFLPERPLPDPCPRRAAVPTLLFRDLQSERYTPVPLVQSPSR